MNAERFHGLGVCTGIAFGKVHIVDRRHINAPHYHLPEKRRAFEVERFEESVAKSERQLKELRDRASDAKLQHAETLLDAHSALLRDEALFDATKDRIVLKGQNAEWALLDTVNQVKKLFERLDEEYFQERQSDVDSVANRLLRNLVGAEVDLLDHISEDAVVVAYDLSPGDTIALAKYSARAFVTETGGPTSHTAIFARALNIPSVLGVHGVLESAGSGDEIIVDGGTGEVVLRPTDVLSGQFRGLARKRSQEKAALLEDRDLPAQTVDGTEIELLGNIEVAQEIATVLQYGGQGIGLYRTEFLHLEHTDLSNAQEHERAYRKVTKLLKDRQVTIRTFDIGADKDLQATTTDVSDTAPPLNPALGLRGIRLSLKNTKEFREQIKGILLVSKESQVRLLLPLVTELDELRQSRDLLESAKEELRQSGRPFNENLPLGVMIETPSAVWIADQLAKEADFFAIGTNDLIQYGLATDRGNEDVSYLYQPSHPAVLRMIDAVCRAAEESQIPVSLCGEMAADPLYVPVLLGLGLRSLSMTATSIPVVKRTIRRLSIKDCVGLAKKVTELPTVTDVQGALKAFLSKP